MLINIPAIQLGIDKKTDIIAFELNINEKLTKLINQQSDHCKNYGQSSNVRFDNCCKKYIKDYLRQTTNCTIPGKQITLSLTSVPRIRDLAKKFKTDS